MYKYGRYEDIVQMGLLEGELKLRDRVRRRVARRRLVNSFAATIGWCSN